MNRYSERSARTYRGNYSTFQSRILAELPHLACDGDSAVLDLTKLQLEHVKGCLTALVHRKKADGTPDSPSKTALTVIRCSIKYAYEMAKIPTPAWYVELGPFFKGLKRTAVENRRILTHRSELGEEGKMPLPFELYRILARRMLQSEILWGHAYGVISWNLLCRTNNTEALSTAALVWKADALNIRQTKSKTDQTGETLRDGYHVFANPFMPEICPILALGLHLALYPIGARGAIFC